MESKSIITLEEGPTIEVPKSVKMSTESKELPAVANTTDMENRLKEKTVDSSLDDGKTMKKDDTLDLKSNKKKSQKDLDKAENNNDTGINNSSITKEVTCDNKSDNTVQLKDIVDEKECDKIVKTTERDSKTQVEKNLNMNITKEKNDGKSEDKNKVIKQIETEIENDKTDDKHKKTEVSVEDKSDIENEKTEDKQKETEVPVEDKSERVPVNESVFVQEHIEPLGSIQDVQSNLIDAAKYVVQKVVTKIDNEIEKKVAEEEKKEFTADKVSSPKREPRVLEQKVEEVESLQYIKDNISEVAKTVVQKVVDKIEEEITKNVENEEKKEIQNITVNEPVFNEEKVQLLGSIYSADMIDKKQANSERMENNFSVNETCKETPEENERICLDEIDKSKDNTTENPKNKEAITENTERDLSLSNADKIREDDVQEACELSAINTNGEDYYWITLGMIGAILVAGVAKFLYYYFNQNI